MIWSDDPVKDYDSYDYQSFLRDMRLPVCFDCGEPIDADELWEFSGHLYCKRCVDSHMQRVEDYIRG